MNPLSTLSPPPEPPTAQPSSSMLSEEEQALEQLAEYRYGFETKIENFKIPKGLNENTIRAISARKKEPDWMLSLRLKAYRHWLTMEEPQWARLEYEPIDFQNIHYFSEPASTADKPKSLDEVDPELLRTYARLGIPLEEQKRLAGIAVDVVFDSVSVFTTFKEELARAGITFCSISEAIHTRPELVKKYFGSVVPYTDNYFAALNAAVFTDGSFVHIPKNTRCPMELSTYFRINAQDTGQFERTLIIAEDNSYVSYLEGCTAPQRDTNQLHAAVVELLALDNAQIKYSTVQNWYPGDKNNKGGIYNFVTKRGQCAGHHSKIMWTQVEVGSAITWKYPSCVLKGDSSVGEFYSVALTRNRQQADTGTKMIHLGRNTASRIVSKGISADESSQTYRGRVSVAPKATGTRNNTTCDSLLIGSNSVARTIPYIESHCEDSTLQHEASAGKINDDQLFYAMARGLSEEQAVALIVSGFCQDVMQTLPMEFAVEARKLLELSLEGAVG